jgi:hypothetical protein
MNGSSAVAMLEDSAYRKTATSMLAFHSWFGFSPNILPRRGLFCRAVR